MPAPDRRGALRAHLQADGLDALLVTDLLDIRYLSGFTGSNAALLVGAAGPEADVFCTDSRYLTQAAGQVGDLRTLIERSCAPALAAEVPAGSTLGFASDQVTVDGHAALAAAAPRCRLQAAPGLVGRMRAVKEPEEVAAIRAACAVADEALAGLLADGGIAAGRTEREVAADLDHRMRRLGADGPAFDTIVAAGVNSATPHHRPTPARLRRGDLVKLDFGAALEGYHSDMTRTFVLGGPADWQRELYDLVAAAQRAGCAALAPDAELPAVDAASRDVIVDAGFGDRFGHGLGHGIGLAVHETPFLSARSSGTLAAGNVVTVEPGVYLPDRGGVRIEDTLLVRPGDAEPLTGTDRALTVL